VLFGKGPAHERKKGSERGTVPGVDGMGDCSILPVRSKEKRKGKKLAAAPLEEKGDNYPYKGGGGSLPWGLLFSCGGGEECTPSRVHARAPHLQRP